MFTHKSGCIFILLLLCGLGVNAQKPFEGRIIFAVDYIDIPTAYTGMQDALPKELLWVVKNENSRMQQSTTLGGEQTVIHRQGEDSLYQLVDVLGQKIKLIQPLQKQAHRFRVTEQDEAREMLGYETKKVTLQTADGAVLTAWCATRFKNPAGSDLPEIKKLPLEYEFQRGEIKMRLTAIEVTEEPVDDTYFFIPNEYAAIPKEEYDRWLR